MVICTLSGKLYASVNERIFCLDEVPKYERVSRYFDTISKPETSTKPKERYIPDMNHPWMKDSFMKYVHSMVDRKNPMSDNIYFCIYIIPHY